MDAPEDEAVIKDQENVDLAKEVFDVATQSEAMLKTLVSALVKAIAETLWQNRFCEMICKVTLNKIFFSSDPLFSYFFEMTTNYIDLLYDKYVVIIYS